jgi:Txe/YoeB family toxin of Txe-Axe toxin-antitoxin module
MIYRFRVAEGFWKKFYRLPIEKKKSVRKAWTLFKANPFDPKLGIHRIGKLSSQYRKTIYSVVIEADLRSIFYIEGDTVWTVDIGTHDIYK